MTLLPILSTFILLLVTLKELPQRLDLWESRAAFCDVNVVAGPIEELLQSAASSLLHSAGMRLYGFTLTFATAFAGGMNFLPIKVTIFNVAGVSTYIVSLPILKFHKAA